MAAPTVTKIGDQATLNVLSASVDTTQDATGGIIVLVLAGARGDDLTPTAADDDVGLTYTLRAEAHDESNGASVYIFTAPVTATLNSGATITATGLSSANCGWQAYVYLVSTCTIHDCSTGTSNSNRTTGHVTGATVEITGINDAAIACVVGYNPATAFTSDWADCTDLDSDFIDSRACAVSWKAVTSGAQEATFDTTASTTSAAAIVVVAEAAGGGSSIGAIAGTLNRRRRG